MFLLFSADEQVQQKHRPSAARHGQVRLQIGPKEAVQGSEKVSSGLGE